MNGRSLYPPLLLRGDEAVLIDYGTRGPSFEALGQEASPAQALRLTTAEGNSLQATVEARSQLPAYTLEGYTLRWIVYIPGDLPMEQHETPLPRLLPGQSATVSLRSQQENPTHIRVDVMRPIGFSALTTIWKA